MYTQFFGFKQRPFVLTPDPNFLFLSKSHDMAMAHLEYGLASNAGFVALTGEVGSGKTTLLKSLLNKIDESLDVAMIFNTHLQPETLLEMLIKEFELTPGSRNKSDLFECLFQHFLKQYTKGRRCVIVADEAQNLPFETFEELRMLSNLEVGDEFLVQIVLVGQPQLRKRLSHPSLAQLAQRISVYYHLSALTMQEVKEYVLHRLNVAGCTRPDPLFEEGSLEFLGEVSRGIPRVINAVCDASLLYAFADGIECISREILERVLSDNELLGLSDRQEANNGSETSAPEASDSPAVAPDGTAPEMMFSWLIRRLEDIETRVSTMELRQQDGASALLRDMLAKERERSSKLERKIVLLLQRCEQFRSQIERAKMESGEEVKRGNGKLRKILGF